MRISRGSGPATSSSGGVNVAHRSNSFHGFSLDLHCGASDQWPIRHDHAGRPPEAERRALERVDEHKVRCGRVALREILDMNLLLGGPREYTRLALATRSVRDE